MTKLLISPYFSHLFAQSNCGQISIREYLVCALYLIKKSLPTIDLIESMSKMYGHCGKGPVRLTRTALHCILNQTIATSIDETVEIFNHIDFGNSGFITIGEFWESLKRVRGREGERERRGRIKEHERDRDKLGQRVIVHSVKLHT